MITAGSILWRRKRLSLADFEDSNDNEHNQDQSCKRLVATFQNEWEHEFLENFVQPSMIRATCIMGSFWFFYDFSISCGRCSQQADGTGGNSSWVLLTYILDPITGSALLIVAALASMPSLRPFFVRYYNSICIFVVVSSYISLLFPSYMLEERRSRFQSFDTPYSIWNISYSGPLPVRTCNDTDPSLTWSTNSDQSPVGCSNLLLSGNYFGTMLLGTISPMIFRMCPRAAAILVLLLCSIFLGACISIGTRPTVFAVILLAQLAAGALGTWFCLLGDLHARVEFAVNKGLRYATEQNGNLLYTLIPQGVVAQCQGAAAAGASADMVGKTLPRVTIMFCALEGHAEMQAAFTEREFDELNAVFSDFDAAVKEHGMFKYQHVGAPAYPPARPPAVLLIARTAPAFTVPTLPNICLRL